MNSSDVTPFEAVSLVGQLLCPASLIKGSIAKKVVKSFESLKKDSTFSFLY